MGKNKLKNAEVIMPAPADKTQNIKNRIYRLRILMGKTFNQITYNVYKKEVEELKKSLKG